MSKTYTFAFLIILISIFNITNCSNNLIKHKPLTAANSPAGAPTNAPTNAPAPAPTPAPVIAPAPVGAPVQPPAPSASSNSTKVNDPALAKENFFKTIFPLLEKIDSNLHKDLKTIYLHTLGENLSTNKDLCQTIEKNEMLKTLELQFDIIKKTNFTHPKVDFEDKYTPFLYHLREKYAQREKNVTEIELY